jgi:hypothetical protein
VDQKNGKRKAQNNQNAREVDQWIQRHLEGLPANRIVSLFGAAIQELLNRALATLSEVTLNAVLDRVLFQSQQKYPCLSGLKFENFRLHPDGLAHSFGENPAEVTEAFRFFLIELLTILENLTAGVITDPLYQELSKVNSRDDMKSRSDRGGT